MTRRRYEHKIAIPVFPDYQIMVGDGTRVLPEPLAQIFVTVNYPEGFEFAVEEALERAQPIAHNIVRSPKWDDNPRKVGSDGY